MDSIELKSKISLFHVKLYRYFHLILHTHSFHEFYFSLSSGGTQYANKKSYSLKKRQLFVLPASVRHYCHADSNDRGVEAVVLYIATDLFKGSSYADMDGQRALSALVKMGREGRHDVQLTAETLKRIEEILLPLSKEKIEESPGYAMNIRSGFERILVLILRDPFFEDVQKQLLPMPSQRLEKVFYFLEAHYPEPLTVEQVSEVAGLSRSHFHAMFRKAAGCGMVAYLNQIRIRKACELLETEDHPLVEVGMMCGFESLAHFYRCFRKYKGMPPGEYRKQSDL